MLLPRRPRRHLTAAASRVTPADSQYSRRLEMPWQNRALYYTDAIGELHYASQFYSRMLQRLRIFPGYRVDDDTVTPITEGLPVDLLNRIQDPGGGRTAILGMYGKLMFVTGEGYLFGRGIGQGREKWSFVWREELRFDDTGSVTHVLAPSVPYETFNLGAANYEELPEGTAVAYRMWTPHPRFSAWPDSPMHAVLEEAEELLILSRAVHATATSRLVRAPLLAIPEEIAPPPPISGGDEDPLNDPFLRDFTEHLEQAVENSGTAAAMAPFVLYAAAEWIDKIKTVNLHDSQSDYLERDLRTECIRRIARGLDLPPEVIEGLGTSNHWSAWLVSDDMWRSHGAPKAEQFCDDISEAYLRPALREAGYARADEVVVSYDASAVVVNPDRSKDADQAHDRGELGGYGYRVMKNIPEEFAPNEEEKLIYLAKNKVIYDSEGNPIPSTGSGAGVAAEEAIVNPGDDPGTPDGEPGPVSEGTNLPLLKASAARFNGAAELALFRCRELAGSRIRSRKKSCPDCLDKITEVPNPLVASALGKDGMEALECPDPRVLVAGGADSLRAMLVAWGYSPDDAATVCSTVELHAARTLLHEAPSVPESLMVWV